MHFHTPFKIDFNHFVFCRLSLVDSAPWFSCFVSFLLLCSTIHGPSSAELHASFFHSQNLLFLAVSDWDPPGDFGVLNSAGWLLLLLLLLFDLGRFRKKSTTNLSPEKNGHFKRRGLFCNNYFSRGLVSFQESIGKKNIVLTWNLKYPQWTIHFKMGVWVGWL